MKKKKLLILIPSLEIGGAEMTLINFLHALDKDRYEPTLFVALKKGHLLKRLPSYVIPIFLTNSRLVLRLANYLYSKIGYSFLLKWLASKIKGEYNIAISFLDGINTDYLLLSKVRYSKIITIIQSNYEKYPQKTKYLNSKVGEIRSKTRYSNVDNIVCVSQSVENGFINIFGSGYNTKVIYNPIPNPKISRYTTSSSEKYGKKFNLVALGRLVPIKGYENLIHAIATLIKKSNYKDIYLKIIGTGPLYHHLKRLIDDLGVTKHIELCGYLEDPYPIINDCQLFVMTSFSEGLPTALCEAMSLGKPVLATNVSGCAEVINNGEYGAICDPTIESIHNALFNLIGNDERLNELADLASKRAKLFSVSKAMNSYYELFEK